MPSLCVPTSSVSGSLGSLVRVVKLPAVPTGDSVQERPALVLM